MHHRYILTPGRDSQRPLQQDNLSIDLCERVPSEVTHVEGHVELANVVQTRLLQSSETPTSGRRRKQLIGSTYDSKVIEMPEVVFLIERLVYQEECSHRFPGMIAEVGDLRSWNDGKLGCRHVYPGLGSHTEQLAGRHEKIRLPMFVNRPWRHPPPVFQLIDGGFEYLNDNVEPGHELHRLCQPFFL